MSKAESLLTVTVFNPVKQTDDKELSSFDQFTQSMVGFVRHKETGEVYKIILDNDGDFLVNSAEDGRDRYFSTVGNMIAEYELLGCMSINVENA